MLMLIYTKMWKFLQKTEFCLRVSQVPLISPHEDDSFITARAASSDRDNTGASRRGLTY